MNHNKHSTPILAAVKRMHADDDAATGRDPYNTLDRRRAKPGFPPATVREADGILACYETELTLETDK